MLKSLTFSITVVAFALLCLSNCSDSGDLKPEASGSLDPLSIFKCQEHLSKSLVAEEIEQLAVLTNSKGKTHVHLDKIGGYCSSNIKIKTECVADTLKLEEYWPEEGSFRSKCGCTLSLDLFIDSVGDDIKYLLYTHAEDTGVGPSIFPVRYK